MLIHWVYQILRKSVKHFAGFVAFCRHLLLKIPLPTLITIEKVAQRMPCSELRSARPSKIQSLRSWFWSDAYGITKLIILNRSLQIRIHHILNKVGHLHRLGLVLAGLVLIQFYQDILDSLQFKLPFLLVILKSVLNSLFGEAGDVELGDIP